MSKRFVLLTTAAFAFLGPPIGVLFQIVPGVVAEAVSSSTELTFSSFELRFLLFVFVVAWLEAGVPAAVAGAVWAIVMWRLHRRRPGILQRLVLGALIGGLAGTGLQLIETATAEPLMLTKCGTLAGALLAALFPRPAWLQPPPGVSPIPPPAP